MELPKKSTIQLFHNDKPSWEDSPIEPIGSGVLFELNEEYYIITAAHVVQGYATKKPINPYKDEDDYDDPSQAYLSLENIGFLYNEAYYPIQRAVFTNTENGVVEKNVDIAVLFLDLTSAKELIQDYTFVSISNILLNHPVKNDTRYFIYGYPAEWTDIDLINRKINISPFKYITKGVLFQDAQNVRYDERYNILLFYDKSKMVDKDRQPIESFTPNGISGCGLWYYSGGIGLKLIGIMIEDKWVQEHQTLMMATKIDVAISIIQEIQNKEDQSSITKPAQK